MGSEQKCYGLDGTPLDAIFGPCKPTGRHSGCCAINRPVGSADICLDNGLCMATSGPHMGTIWQHGCTDPTGKDPSCPQMCPDVRDNFGGLQEVRAWNIQTCDYGRYCCREVNDRKNCCHNATAPHIITSSVGAFPFPTSTAGLFSPAAAAAAVVTPSPSSSADIRTASLFGTAVSTGEPFTQSTSTQLSSFECKPDKSGVVGGAVGGILGAALLGMVGIVLWLQKKEKHQRRLKEHYEEQFGQNFAYRRTVVVESDSREMLSSPDNEKKTILSEN